MIRALHFTMLIWKNKFQTFLIFNSIINDLIEFHDTTIKRYIHSYKREDQFLIVCGYAIDSLKSSGFREKDMKQITREAIEHFSGQGYNVLYRRYRENF